MKRLNRAWLAVVAAPLVGLTLAAQSVYPTGTTIYDPDRAWNGYTVLSPLATQAVLVIDMNGTVVKRWDGYNNSAGGPARVLPGGFVVAASGARPPHQESLELIQRDFARQRPLAVFPRRANHDARGQHGLVGASAPRLAARELSSRLLLAREHASDRRRQHADPDPHRSEATERWPTCRSKTTA